MGRVDIILATYNGARFLEAQLQSLEAQSHRDFRIIARDDGSTDDTVAILERAAARFGERFLIVREGTLRKGACQNFAAALAYSDAPYVMFCDQDDWWLPQKIELTLARARRREAELGATHPILVHTDAVVVDDHLKPLSPSMWRYQRMDPEQGSGWRRLLLSNVAVGCTTLLNRALIRRSPTIPEEAVMHDWWFALVASVFGRMDAEPTPTVLYRQHAANEAGAQAYRPLQLLLTAAARRRGQLKRTLARTQAQAAAFMRAFGPDLPEETARVIREYARLKELAPPARWAFLLSEDIHYDALPRNLLLLLRA